MSNVTTAFQMATVFNLDDKQNTVTYVDIQTTSFKSYIGKLIFQSLNAKNRKEFLISNEATQVASTAKNLVNESINHTNSNYEELLITESKNLAERLVRIQKKRAEKFPGINAPKKGSLVTIITHHEDKIHFLLSKIDEEIFLDLSDSEYKAGLPDEKATQKTCNITYKVEEDYLELEDVIVTDTQKKMSNFWFDEFLELVELHDDEKNTKKAFNSIDRFISRYVGKEHRNDYTQLRNNLSGYFLTHSSFKLDDMIEYVIGDITLSNDSINIDDFKQALSTLPKIKDFDEAFNIQTNVIDTKFKKTYKINEKIELRTTGYLSNLKDTITAKQNNLGEYVLEIKNIDAKTFKSFNFNDEDNLTEQED